MEIGKRASNIGGFFLMAVKPAVDFDFGFTAMDADELEAVQHFFNIFERHIQEITDSARQALQEPYVSDWCSEVNVTEALTANSALNHLDAALLTDDAPVLHALVLAAVALVVLDRAEDLRAEEAVPFGLEGPVVDRLGLLDFAERPLPDLLRRGERDPQRVERERILGLLEQIVEIAQWGSSSPELVLIFHELDIEAERLKFLDENVEALGQSRLQGVLALHN